MRLVRKICIEKLIGSMQPWWWKHIYTDHCSMLDVQAIVGWHLVYCVWLRASHAWMKWLYKKSWIDDISWALVARERANWKCVTVACPNTVKKSSYASGEWESRCAEYDKAQKLGSQNR